MRGRSAAFSVGLRLLNPLFDRCYSTVTSHTTWCSHIRLKLANAEASLKFHNAEAPVRLARRWIPLATFIRSILNSGRPKAELDESDASRTSAQLLHTAARALCACSGDNFDHQNLRIFQQLS